MRADRYLKVILTIIAVELGWIGLQHTGSPVSAQQTATPVVITGIDLEKQADYLPVSVLGQVRNVPPQPLDDFNRSTRRSATRSRFRCRCRCRSTCGRSGLSGSIRAGR